MKRRNLPEIHARRHQSRLLAQAVERGLQINLHQRPGRRRHPPLGAVVQRDVAHHLKQVGVACGQEKTLYNKYVI